jgi:hypothetical protein
LGVIYLNSYIGEEAQEEMHLFLGGSSLLWGGNFLGSLGSSLLGGHFLWGSSLFGSGGFRSSSLLGSDLLWGSLLGSRLSTDLLGGLRSSGLLGGSGFLGNNLLGGNLLRGSSLWGGNLLGSGLLWGSLLGTRSNSERGLDLDKLAVLSVGLQGLSEVVLESEERIY